MKRKRAHEESVKREGGDGSAKLEEERTGRALIRGSDCRIRSSGVSNRTNKGG